MQNRTTTVNEILTLKKQTKNDRVLSCVLSFLVLARLCHEIEILQLFVRPLPSPSPSCTTVMSCTPNVWSQSLITSHLIKKLYTSWGTVKALLTRKIKFPNSVATASFAVSCGDLFSIQSPEGKSMSAEDRTARGLKDQIHVTELKYKGWLYCFMSFFLKLALCVFHHEQNDATLPNLT